MYGVFTYVYHKNQPHVGKYTSPMDGMGYIYLYIRFLGCKLKKKDTEPLQFKSYLHGFFLEMERTFWLTLHPRHTPLGKQNDAIPGSNQKFKKKKKVR